MLGRLGQRLFLLGDDPGAANLMKVAANALTALTLQSMGEVLALLRKGGVDARAATNFGNHHLGYSCPEYYQPL
jgi:3-hydroxyisobutyrate dehydrogenase-like beta-hydroxyacid dehydrogenase